MIKLALVGYVRALPIHWLPNLHELVAASITTTGVVVITASVVSQGERKPLH
jgi:hypothetical protein